MSDLTGSKTILAQLGGSMFRMMTGAKDFVGGDDPISLSFRIGRNDKNITHVRIILAGNDTYTMEFVRVRKLQRQVKAIHTDVYAEDLQRIFTAETGMDTRL